MKRNLLSIEDINRDDLDKIIAFSADLKKHRGTMDYSPLKGKSIGMIFAKSSTRTRISFEVGIRELGGNPLYLEQSKMQVGRGESVADTAKVLSRYLHGIVIRTYKHEDIIVLAEEGSIPVINALTDAFHPCQVLTDLFTIYEFSKKLDGVKLVFVGDAQCNMANSLILGAKLAGIELVISSPEEFKPSDKIINAPFGTGSARWEPDPHKAAEGADYIYTDVWVSMGCEDEAEYRLNTFRPYQVNAALLACAPEARIMHCLPAHRGEEITDDAVDSPRSIVFDQAENRLHVQKAILGLIFDEINNQ
jgi:ornithine carbamoyltransferase